MRILSWSKTDVGEKRDHNEDSHLRNDNLKLYVVADGMGGHKAGDVASRIAVETIERYVAAQMAEITSSDSPDTGNKGKTQMFFVAEDPVIDMLKNAIQEASRAILDEVDRDPEKTGMGTTCSLIFVHNNQPYYGHVGDSRIYRIREGNIEQVSTDHSLVQEQVDMGLITAEEAEQSQYKNIITRSVGFERNINVDSEKIESKQGDLFLMCSDGLSGLVHDNELRDIGISKDPATALQFYINLANSRGGDDNITAVMIRLDPDEIEETTEEPVEEQD